MNPAPDAPRAWQDRWWGRLLLGLALPAAVLLAWHLGSRGGSAVLPTIPEVLDVLAHPLRDPPHLDSRPLLASAGLSMLRVLLGFTVAALAAVPLGLWAGRSVTGRRIVSPLVEVLRPVCPIAWLPLAIIVFGLASLGSLLWGDASWRHDILAQLRFAMIFIIAWGAFFPIFLNTAAAVAGVRELYVEAARTLGASPGQVFRKVVLPASLPGILTGLRTGMGLAWMVIVAAEMFPGTRAGLGYMIVTAHQVAQYEYAFAALAVIGAIGLCVDAVLHRVERRVGRWTALER